MHFLTSFTLINSHVYIIVNTVQLLYLFNIFFGTSRHKNIWSIMTPYFFRIEGPQVIAHRLLAG